MAEAHVVRDGRSNLFLVKVFTVSIFLLPVRIQPEEEQVEESRGVPTELGKSFFTLW